MKSIAMTKNDLAAIAGYSYRRLFDIDRDLPKNKKLFVPSEANPKRFDLAIFVQRWVEYNTDIAEEESEELAVVKARHEVIKTRKTEIEVKRLEGEYVRVQDVDEMWRNIASLVKNRFLNLARKLAPALVNLDSADTIEWMIDREVRDGLNMIADTPLPGEEKRIPTSGDEDEDEDG